ncbi:MAG: methionine ABC transporter substrate-binding protein, partial [Rhodospirillales bacterium]|nr:methionine ABC transporter substrate-binding protein [Rhodospirillales bacterium]
LKVKELDAAQLPRSLDDVDFAVVNLNYALTSGLDPKKAIVLEAADTPYNLVFAVRNKDRDNASIRRFVDLYRSPQVKEFMETKFQGTIIPTW